MLHLWAYDMAGENGQYAWMEACRNLIIFDYNIVWC